MLKVYSGKVMLCEAGQAVGNGLHTGDIVIVWHGEHVGTDNEQFYPVEHMSVVVKEGDEPYVMGIRSCGLDHPEWKIQVVKKYSDVVAGERWPSYGFSFHH